MRSILMSDERLRLVVEKSGRETGDGTKVVLFGCKMRRLSTYQERGGVMFLHN